MPDALPDTSSPDREAASPAPRAASYALRLAIAWLIVGAPALWGVSQVIKKSLALFR